MKRLFLISLLLLLIIPVSADTVIQWADLTSNQMDGTDQNWLPMRNASGTSVAGGNSWYTGYTVATSENPKLTYHYRGSVNFPHNASLTAGSTITGATVDVRGRGVKYNALGTAALSLINFTPGAYPFATGDYDSTGYVRMASDIPYASVSTSGWNTFTLNADGLSRVSATSNTTFILTHSYDTDFTNLTWSSAATTGYVMSTSTDSAGIYKPYLTITFIPASPPDTTPPNAITGLSVSLIDCNKTAVNWTNPTNADYYRLNAWNNGVLTNLSNTTTSQWLTGLTNNTVYTFNSTTEDLSGNRNTTHWQNISWSTASCPWIPPTTSPTPTPTPTVTQMTGCSWVNITNASVSGNFTNWSLTSGLLSWGTTVYNQSQGNISFWSCMATTSPTPTPIWTPIINPSTEIEYTKIIDDWWWLPCMILIMILIFRRR